MYQWWFCLYQPSNWWVILIPYCNTHLSKITMTSNFQQNSPSEISPCVSPFEFFMVGDALLLIWHFFPFLNNTTPQWMPCWEEESGSAWLWVFDVQTSYFEVWLWMFTNLFRHKIKLSHVVAERLGFGGQGKVTTQYYIPLVLVWL